MHAISGPTIDWFTLHFEWVILLEISWTRKEMFLLSLHWRKVEMVSARRTKEGRKCVTEVKRAHQILVSGESKGDKIHKRTMWKCLAHILVILHSSTHIYNTFFLERKCRKVGKGNLIHDLQPNVGKWKENQKVSASLLFLQFLFLSSFLRVAWITKQKSSICA